MQTAEFRMQTLSGFTRPSRTALRLRPTGSTFRVVSAFCILNSALLAGTLSAQRPSNAREALDRAVEDFLAGRITESVAGFDQVVKLAPDAAPQLWQGGAALSYTPRYRACRAQRAQIRRTS